MRNAPWWRTGLVFLPLAACGCGSPPLIQIATVIHGDGSCDRTIWQPRDEMLPDEALKPAWNARWKSIDLAAIPPELAKQAKRGQKIDGLQYFSAQGYFQKTAEIPRHFRCSLEPDQGALASELVQSYECKDYGFVREHRWRETLTNFVTKDRFVKARDGFLNLALPRIVQGIEEVYGNSFDVTGLTKYLLKDGRSFLEQAALVFYDTMANHITDEEQPARYAKLAHQFGLDLFDSAGNLASAEERETRFKSFLRHRIVLGLRHRDGSRLTEHEVRSILDQDTNSTFSRAWLAYWNQHEKVFKKQLLPLIYRMTGPFNPPFDWSRGPVFVFDLHLPGQVVESNGTFERPDHVRWRFTGDQSFPDGYVMRARSIEIILQRQRKKLGRAPMSDIKQAQAYNDQ
jgi:hypothetical protein